MCVRNHQPEQLEVVMTNTKHSDRIPEPAPAETLPAAVADPAPPAAGDVANDAEEVRAPAVMSSTAEDDAVDEPGDYDGVPLALH